MPERLEFRSALDTRLEWRAGTLDAQPEGVLSGYAAIYNVTYRNPDGVLETMLPGSLEVAPDVWLEVNHGTVPLARAPNNLEVRSDAKGLSVRAQLDMEDPEARNLFRKIQRRDYRSMSLAMQVLKDKMVGGVREISKAIIRRVAVVAVPANPLTSVEVRGGTMNELERLRARREQAAAAHAALLGEIADAAEGTVITDTTELETRAAAAAADIIRLDTMIDAAVAVELRSQQTAETAARIHPRTPGSPSESIQVTSEPLEYRAGGHHSFIGDMILARQGDPDAQHRLERHTQQERDRRIEFRAMTLVDGAGGGYVVPKVLVDDLIPVRRAGRVVADLVTKKPLLRTDVIQIPKVLTGTLVGMQTAVNTALANADPTDAFITTNVRTLGGFVDLPQQLIDFSDINQDQTWFDDLRRDTERQIEQQVLSGTNAAGQIMGILTSAGIQNVPWVDATPTVPEFYTFVGKAIGLIDDANFLPAELVMATRRNIWAQTAVDANGRPFVLPSDQGAANTLARVDGSTPPPAGYAGRLLGLDMYADSQIPKTLGAGTEDVALVADLRETYLYESPLFTRVDYGTGSSTLTVRLVVWKYIASSGALRNPLAYCTITGTGMIAPA